MDSHQLLCSAAFRIYWAFSKDKFYACDSTWQEPHTVSKTEKFYNSLAWIKSYVEKVK